MDLGLDFEDSDFVQEEKQRPLLTSYNAKIYSPQWFLDKKADNSQNDKATLYKFRGDYYYRLMDYRQAIQCYDVSLGNLGSQNRTMRREVTESLARCHVNLGHTDKAVELSDQVLNDCLTKDQTVQCLILKQQIYQKAGLVAEEIRILYRLIHVHPRNVEFWSSVKRVFETIQRTQSEQRNGLLSETCKMPHQSVINKERQPNQSGTDTNYNHKAMPRDVKDVTHDDKSVKGIFDKGVKDVCDRLKKQNGTSTTLTKDSNSAMRTSAETLEQNLASLSTESQAIDKVDSNSAMRTSAETLEQNLASLSTESQAIDKVDSNCAMRTSAETLKQNLASLSTESQAIDKVDSNCAMRTSAETLEQNLASLSTESQAIDKVDSNCAMRTSAETLKQNLASLSTESQAIDKVDSNSAMRTSAETLEQNLASLSTESQAIDKVDSNCAMRTSAETLEQNLASLSTESQAIDKVDSNCAMRTSAETLEQNLASLSTESQAIDKVDSNSAMRTSAETLEQNLASLSTESQAIDKVDSNSAMRTSAETLEQNLASLSTESQAIDKVDSNSAMRTSAETLEQNLASLSTEFQAMNKVCSNRAMRTSADTLEQNLASLSMEPQAVNKDVKQIQYSTSNGFIDDGSDYDDILTGLSCRLLVLTCCVRIRLILQSVQGTVGSFIKEKNLELQKQIDRQISSIGVSDDIFQRVTEFMKKDMFEDDYGENNSVENEDKEIPTLTAAEFNRRWFSWIQDT